MFQITPLPAQTFSHLFGLAEADLAERGVLARVAGEGDRFPCRVSLRDARPGERALLMNFEHQPANTPYRSSYAIFVIDGATEAVLEPGELPAVFHKRPLAVRAFDGQGLLIDAGLAMGAEIAPTLTRLLDNPSAAYLHVHNAMHGCYSARVDRA